MGDVKKMAAVRLTSDALCELLQLPPEAELRMVVSEAHMRDGAISLVFEGVGTDVARGQPLPPYDTACVERRWIAAWTRVEEPTELAHKIKWPFLS